MWLRKEARKWVDRKEVTVEVTVDDRDAALRTGRRVRQRNTLESPELVSPV